MTTFAEMVDDLDISAEEHMLAVLCIDDVFNLLSLLTNNDEILA